MKKYHSLHFSILQSSLFLVVILAACSKSGSGPKGHYSIHQITNTLGVQVQLEMGRVDKKLPSHDPDYTKNLVYRPFAQLTPGQTIVLDSQFVCVENCETILNEGDPEFNPIFLKKTIGDKVVIDTNCNHIYVFGGLIKNCSSIGKSYFNKDNFSQQRDALGNLIILYKIDQRDLKN